MVESRFKRVLDVIATVAVIVASGVVVWTFVFRSPSTQQEAAAASGPSVPTTPIPLGAAPTLGAVTARVAIVEFSDFQCPFCARFATETMPGLRAKYVDSGQVLWSFRHLPLANHPAARPAAEASECAAKQGKFWEFHDRLFSAPGRFSPDELAAAATAIGLDVEGFRACVDTGVAVRMAEDAQLAASLQLSGTPIFFVGRLQSDLTVRISEIIRGAQPLAAFEQAIERAAKKD